VLRRIAEAEPTPIRDVNPQIPEWLCLLIGKLMAKDPSDRFSTAREVKTVLEACLQHVQQPATAALPEIPGLAVRPPQTWPLLPSSRGILTMSALSVAALAALLFFALPGTDGTAPPPGAADAPPGAVEQAEAADGKTVVAEDGPAASAPLTWKSLLGEEPPPGFDPEPLSLIQALDNSRGEWAFAGKIVRDGAPAEFEATLRIRGGFKNMIRQGGMPQYQAAIAWPRDKPTEVLVLNILPVPEAEGIELMLAAGYSTSGGGAVGGQAKMYRGVWDPARSLVVWTPTEVRIQQGQVSSAQPSGDVPGSFDMLVKPHGALQLRGYQHSASLSISGQAVARVGASVAEEAPAISQLPGGYQIFYASPTEVYLATPASEVVAGPRLEQIGCSGDLIFGRLTLWHDSAERSDTSGYFWLDVQSGEMAKGLELPAWRAALEGKGVAAPRLVAPESVGGQD
jgi:hypothetical protein